MNKYLVVEGDGSTSRVEASGFIVDENGAAHFVDADGEIIHWFDAPRSIVRGEAEVVVKTPVVDVIINTSSPLNEGKPSVFAASGGVRVLFLEEIEHDDELDAAPEFFRFLDFQDCRNEEGVSLEPFGFTGYVEGCLRDDQGRFESRSVQRRKAVQQGITLQVDPPWPDAPNKDGSK